MHGEKTQEKDYDMPTEMFQPELAIIIQRLQSIVNYYYEIVFETQDKLRKIKRPDGTSEIKEDVKEKQPESATEEINRLLSRLDDLNAIADRNLQHLREIV